MRDARRNEFGDFLKSRRLALSPTELGLPRRRRRRTPGLRREEVAERAGIGVDWYIRLEQGRTVHPSETTVDGLASALCLDRAEHAHLRALARPARISAFRRETVPAGLGHMVDNLSTPAYIVGRRWDLLAWNRAAVAIFGDFDTVAPGDRNILVYMLTTSAARRLFAETWAEEARAIIGRFRSSHDLLAGDPAFVALRDRLEAESPEFRRWWEAHDVRGLAAGRKRLVLPDGEAQEFEHASFQSNDDPNLRLVVYTPA